MKVKLEGIATIYKGAILTLLTYGAPVWNEAISYEHNRNTSECNISLHPNCKGVSNHVQRDDLYVDENDSHAHKTGRKTPRYKVKQKSGHCDIECDFRRGNSKTATTGRSWENSQSGTERGNINVSVH